MAFLNTAPLVHEHGAVLSDDDFEHLLMDHPQAAEACTEIGADDRDPQEGKGAIVIPCLIGGIVAVALAWHLFLGYLT